jgi:hypothetical protein
LWDELKDICCTGDQLVEAPTLKGLAGRVDTDVLIGEEAETRW